MRIVMIMMILVMVIFIICSVVLIFLLGRKNIMECFYVEDNILYLNFLFVKKILFFDIRNIEFKIFCFCGSYSGKIIVNLKNVKVIKCYF